MIPVFNPKANYLAHQAEIDEAMRQAIVSGQYILGENVRLIEREFSAYIGAKHAVGVGNGTDAIRIALTACGVKPGDEVITVSFTATGTVAAIRMAGATPVLIDIDPRTYTIDAGLIESAVTAKTRAIVPVHLYGQMADIDAILTAAKKHDLRVIEDCAQAHGAAFHGRKAGAWGDAAAFSFYPTKNLGALGDGGMVVTSDAEIARRAGQLREYGWEPKHVSRIEGVNSRLDELQAAVLRVKLRHLDAENARRRELADVYRFLLPETSFNMPAVMPGAEHVYHLFVIRSERRETLVRHLHDCGVRTLVHYYPAVHQQPAYHALAEGRRLDETERAARQVLSLPMYPELSEEDAGKVADALMEFDAPA